MKNPRAILMLILSLLIGLAATAMAAGWVAKQGRVASNKIAVAAMDLELGTRLDPNMLKLVDWPSGSVPPGVFNDLQLLQDRVVRTSVLRGEPVLEPKLAPIGTKGGLSAVIPEGKRAMTVRVNDVIGVAGFALPGNYVDIVVNTQLDGEGSGDKQISKIVLEHILVLAVAQEANRDETKPKVVNAVTLEVTPEQAEKLDLARSVGSLSLVLRNQVDKDDAATRGIMKHQLLTGEIVPQQPSAEPPKTQPSKPQRSAPPATTKNTNKVEVIKGVHKDNVEL